MSIPEPAAAPVDEASTKGAGDLESGLPEPDKDESSTNTQKVPSDTVKREEDGTIDHDPDLIVWWDEPADQDPANPMNWPSSRKWGTIAVLSSITFLT